MGVSIPASETWYRLIEREMSGFEPRHSSLLVSLIQVPYKSYPSQCFDEALNTYAHEHPQRSVIDPDHQNPMQDH